MKNFLWILTITLLFTHCANENPKNTVAQTDSSETVTPAEPGHHKASPDSPYIGLWVVQFALGSTDEDKNAIPNEYQGRWFSLKPDNTFESGKWQESNNTGNWSFDPETHIILLNFKNQETIGHEWKIQGSGERMVWLGNTPNNSKGTQLKLTRETKLPVQK